MDSAGNMSSRASSQGSSSSIILNFRKFHDNLKRKNVSSAPTASINSSSAERIHPILTKKAQRIACCEFIVLLLSIICFLVLAWLQEDIQSIFAFENSIRIQVLQPFGAHSKTIEDVSSVELFWQYLDESLLPTLINHKDEIGNDISKEDWGYLAYYNQVIGGVRLSQERSMEKSCEYDRIHNFYGECQPIFTSEKESFGYPACTGNTNSSSLNKDVDDNENITLCYDQTQYEGVVDFYNDEAFSINERTNTFELWIDLYEDEDSIHKRVRYLKERHWLDRQTKKVVIEFLAYNGQDNPLISKSKLQFDFTRVGHVNSFVTIETIPLDPYFSLFYLKTFLEALFVLALLYIIVVEMYKVVDTKNRLILLQQKQKSKKRRKVTTWWLTLKKHYNDNETRFGSWVDLISIAIGVGICVEWVILVSGLSTVELKLQELERPRGAIQYDDNDSDEWRRYFKNVVDLEENVQYAINNMMNIRSLAAFVIFGMMFRMFKVWEGIPSLRGVSDTIVIAGKNLMSFSLILACLIVLFAGSGMLAFGKELKEFRDLPSSVITTLLVMTLGNTEVVYEKQYAIEPILGSIWHWSLICVMNLTCLNLILCMLVDAYGEAHSEHENPDRLTMPTLFEQTYDTLSYYGSYMACGHQNKPDEKAQIISSNKVSPFPVHKPVHSLASTASQVEMGLSKTKEKCNLENKQIERWTPRLSMEDGGVNSIRSSVDKEDTVHVVSF